MTDAPIALVFSGFGPGGVPRVMLALAREFLAAGHAVDLVVARNEGPARKDVPEGARVVDLESRHPRGSWRRRLRKNRHRVLTSAPALADYIDEARPTAMLSGGNYVNLVAVRARARSRHRPRLVVSHHAQLSIEASGKPVARWIARHAYPKADAVAAVSDGVADDLARRAGLPRERIVTVYNPAVTPEIAAMAEQAPEHPWLQADGPPVILGAGRLTAQKDFPTLIRAFARVAGDRDLRLIVLGEGKDGVGREALLRLARELGVEARIDLPGFAANPYAYMRRAAVFVLSSAWEGFGNVLAEAMACGCPVVSTDCPSGPAEILGGGEFGRLAPVGDDAALARAIAETLDDPPPAERLRRRAEAFSARNAANRYLALLLESGPRASADRREPTGAGR